MEGDIRSSSSDISDSSENARTQQQQSNGTPKKKINSATNSPKQFQKKTKLRASQSN